MDLEQRLSDLIDDPDFQAVNRRMGRFNLFEAVGAVRGELRRSNFLAFLLSPSRNHGLGSEPLLRFLRMILAGMPADKRPIRALELIVGDLDGAVVYREWNSIDLLIEIEHQQVWDVDTVRSAMNERRYRNRMFVWEGNGRYRRRRPEDAAA